jgi:1-acyl-sn-glycerol-3-phosphate acyltransferase
MLIYIFLSRKRENDIPHIRRALAYLIYSNALEPLSAEVVASGASNSKVSEAVLLGGANFMNDNSPPDGLTTYKTDRHSSHHSNNPSADVGSGATASSQVSSSAPTAAAVMMQLRKPTVIIFPEGTDLSERNKQRSNACTSSIALLENTTKSCCCDVVLL